MHTYVIDSNKLDAANGAVLSREKDGALCDILSLQETDTSEVARTASNAPCCAKTSGTSTMYCNNHQRYLDLSGKKRTRHDPRPLLG